MEAPTISGGAMFDAIVVGVDDSTHADQAVRVAGQLARATGDTVVVVHERDVYPGGRGGPVALETMADATAVVDRRVAQLVAAGVPASGEVQRGFGPPVGRALLDAAERHGAGLLVVGTRGRSDVASMILGSVAHEVIQHARIPVLVVPDEK
jgi:nucleotide-binding universal stress UspA family protein